MRYWVLKGKEAEEVELLTWARWFETAENRVVAKWSDGGVEVSTVFLGIDCSLRPSVGQPLLFETMVFGGLEDGHQVRTETWDEALEAHAEAMALVLEVAVPG